MVPPLPPKTQGRCNPYCCRRNSWIPPQTMQTVYVLGTSSRHCSSFSLTVPACNWRTFIILLFDCPTLFPLMPATRVLHVRVQGDERWEQGKSSICLAFRGWELLLSGFCPFEEQLRGREWTHTGEQDEMLLWVFVCVYIYIKDLSSAACLDHPLDPWYVSGLICLLRTMVVPKL